jgi:hypothetical protein
MGECKCVNNNSVHPYPCPHPERVRACICTTCTLTPHPPQVCTPSCAPNPNVRVATTQVHTLILYEGGCEGVHLCCCHSHIWAGGEGGCEGVHLCCCHSHIWARGEGVHTWGGWVVGGEGVSNANCTPSPTTRVGVGV